jgi:hypothetical protein
MSPKCLHRHLNVYFVFGPLLAGSLLLPIPCTIIRISLDTLIQPDLDF